MAYFNAIPQRRNKATGLLVANTMTGIDTAMKVGVVYTGVGDDRGHNMEPSYSVLQLERPQTADICDIDCNGALFSRGNVFWLVVLVFGKCSYDKQKWSQCRNSTKAITASFNLTFESYHPWSVVPQTCEIRHMQCDYQEFIKQTCHIDV